MIIYPIERRKKPLTTERKKIWGTSVKILRILVQKISNHFKKYPRANLINIPISKTNQKEYITLTRDDCSIIFSHFSSAKRELRSNSALVIRNFVLNGKRQHLLQTPNNNVSGILSSNLYTNSEFFSDMIDFYEGYFSLLPWVTIQYINPLQYSFFSRLIPSNVKKGERKSRVVLNESNENKNDSSIIPPPTHPTPHTHISSHNPPFNTMHDEDGDDNFRNFQKNQQQEEDDDVFHDFDIEDVYIPDTAPTVPNNSKSDVQIKNEISQSGEKHNNQNSDQNSYSKENGIDFYSHQIAFNGTGFLHIRPNIILATAPLIDTSQHPTNNSIISPQCDQL